MSQKVVETDEIVENGHAEVEPNEMVDVKTSTMKEPVNEEEEKMEVDPVVIRRQSQNSENNGNDGTDNVTPVQTDNDNDEVRYKFLINFEHLLKFDCFSDGTGHGRSGRKCRTER